MSSRIEQRSDLDPAVRLRLIEVDMDHVFAALTELRKDMQSSFREGEDKIDQLRKLLTGLLVMMVTTSVTIVATVLIAGGGR